MIKDLTIKILNWFPNKVKPGSSSRLTSIVVMLLVGLCLTLCFLMVQRIEPKLAFFVDAYELPTKQGITIGERSDICFAGVPHDYLQVTANDDGSFSWKVNDAYRDSLMYFKLNDKNPQRHEVLDDAGQTIQIVLPKGSYNKCDTLTLTGEEIWDEWDDGFEEQKDVMVRHFAARYGLAHDSHDEDDSLRWMSYCDERKVQSFFERTNSGIVLVILDNNTFVREKGADHWTGYARSGDVMCEGEQYGRLKVQFFQVTDHCYMNGDVDDGTFQVNGVNYAMKAMVKLTDWGAGHAMIDVRRGEGCRVVFPKGVGYVGTLDSLYDNCSKTSHVFTFRQKAQSFPTGTDIYVPQISRALNQDLCIVKMNSPRKVVIRDNNNDSVKVTKATTWKLPFSIVPTLRKVTLRSGDTKVDCRVGIIDHSFAYSYIILPLLVALVLIVLVLCRWSPVRVNVDAILDDPYYSISQLQRYPAFMASLIMIAFAYSVCKSLIALKLSYTYPYFEKLTGITPVVTSLFLIVFFTLAMVLNFRITKAMEGDKDELYGDVETQRGGHKWLAWGVVTALFAAVCFVLLKVLDHVVSSAAIESYFHSQIYSLNVFKWRDIFGINDTHRSVPYTLMLAECILLAVWLVQNCYYQWSAVSGVMQSIGRRAERLWSDGMQKTSDLIAGQWDKLRQEDVYHRLTDVHNTVRRHAVWKAARIAYRKMEYMTKKYYATTLMLLMALMLLAFFFEHLTKPCIVLALILMAIYVWDAFVLAIKALFPWHILLLVLLATVGPMLGNFGTAFISIAVIIGLCRALTSVSFTTGEDGDDGMETRHVVFFEMVIISSIYIVCAMVADNGYMTNYIGFILAVMCFYFIMDKNGEWYSTNQDNAERESKWVGLLLSFVLVALLALPTLCSRLVNVNEVNYGRVSRRIMLYSNFGELQKSGFRYAENDAEFMVIMSHYMQMKDGGDPLSNETHFLHASVSTGQSPVVLNDLSVPVAFIGSYGVGMASAVYFMLMFALLLLVVQFSMAHESSVGYESYLTNAMQWRLLAVFMWVGTSFYIYLSYIDWLPFAGRLNPGFGVDAVGEALESAILLAFMAVVTVRRG